MQLVTVFIFPITNTKSRKVLAKRTDLEGQVPIRLRSGPQRAYDLVPFFFSCFPCELPVNYALRPTVFRHLGLDKEGRTKCMGTN